MAGRFRSFGMRIVKRRSVPWAAVGQPPISNQRGSEGISLSEAILAAGAVAIAGIFLLAMLAMLSCACGPGVPPSP